MKLYKITKWIHKIELVLGALVILSGFYDHSFWLYGIMTILLPFVVIVYILLIVDFIYYSETMEIRQRLKKMAIINSLLLIPVAVLFIYLLLNPIEIRFM